MKITILSIILILLANNLYGQNITIDENGIVKCAGVAIGTTEVVNGDTYEVVDRNLLIQRRDEVADLTKVCVSNVTDMSDMFRYSPINQPIGNWDVSNVTNMFGMFAESQFNQPIGDWDVSNVTEMSAMFFQSPFNQPIGNWDVRNVTEMSAMFFQSPFNQPIGNWVVSNVTEMSSMFMLSQFNQPIGDWDVSKVTSMQGLFSYSQFNQPIGDWDVSNVTIMFSMFNNSQFNQPIGDWDVSSVIGMQGMFRESRFNQPIGDWDVSSVIGMQGMFWFSPFNQPIGNWDVGNVTNMESMFELSRFNQPINNWCVFKITTEPDYFSFDSPLTPENKPLWGTCTGLPLQHIQLAPQNNSIDVSRTPQLSWKSDSVSTKYQLQLFQGINLAVVDTLISDTLYTNLTPLKYGFDYNWRVRGINENRLIDGEPMTGEWSEFWKFTTEIGFIGVITLLSPTNGSTVDELTTTLTWNSDDIADIYEIQISTDFFTTIIVGQIVADTTLSTPDLYYSTDYQWRVRGSNLSGNGEWSQVWKFTTGVDTSIDAEDVPTQFILNQNYPNPFNPTTQIQFSLPVSTVVRLEVFSVLGQRTVTLLNEQMPAGFHTVPFDARSLSSGVYIYRLTTPEFTQSRLMNLIK